MTFDQLVHLLAVLAWPAVAIIAGIAWVHGCRLLAEAAQNSATKISHDATFDTTRKLQLATSFLQSTVPATLFGIVGKSQKEKIQASSERALLAVLTARGGFPAKQGEAPGRSLVREIREMYAELDSPTPAPVPAPIGPEVATTGQAEGGDGLVADDIFAEYIETDEDARQDLGVLDEELQ